MGPHDGEMYQENNLLNNIQHFLAETDNKFTETSTLNKLLSNEKGIIVEDEILNRPDDISVLVASSNVGLLDSNFISDEKEMKVGEEATIENPLQSKSDISLENDLKFDARRKKKERKTKKRNK